MQSNPHLGPVQRSGLLQKLLSSWSSCGKCCMLCCVCVCVVESKVPSTVSKKSSAESVSQSTVQRREVCAAGRCRVLVNGHDDAAASTHKSQCSASVSSPRRHRRQQQQRRASEPDSSCKSSHSIMSDCDVSNDNVMSETSSYSSETPEIYTCTMYVLYLPASSTLSSVFDHFSLMCV